ncbi:MAG: helix-turn-helix domain-containing protein [Chloroflexota bacterium]
MRRARRWDRRRIRALRQHLGLTQGKLAARLGIRQQTVSEWETGRYEPRGSSETLLSMVAEQSGFTYGQKEGTGQEAEDRDAVG